MLSGHWVDGASLQVLRPEGGQRGWEDIVEARSEHDNELKDTPLASSTPIPNHFLWQNSAGQASSKRLLTGISGLSARTYSCGGDAGRFFSGGLSTVGAEVIAPVFKKNLAIPLDCASRKLSPSEDGGDDSGDESLNDIGLMWLVVTVVEVVVKFRLRGRVCGKDWTGVRWGIRMMELARGTECGPWHVDAYGKDHLEHDCDVQIARNSVQ